MRYLLLSLIFAFACGDDDTSDAGGLDAGADAGLDAGSDAADAGPDSPDLSDAGPDAFDAAAPPGPNRFCPGSEDCMDPADGMLSVGAARVEITASFDENREVMTVDVDGDGIYEPADGDLFEDINGNRRFDAAWIAGYGMGRPAAGVADPQWASAIVLENGDTRIALVSLDVVGYFHDDVVRARMRLSDADLDYLAVMATHTHEARDTLGQWGEGISRTGVDLEYMDFLYGAIEQAVREAIAALRPANVEYATTFIRDGPGGVRRYVSDSRDPQILDDEIRVIRFMEAGGDETIATLINFASHPEYLGSRNTLLSSDFAHGLREGVENGAQGPTEALEGVGGIAVFFNGAVGSQIGPNDLDSPQTFDGEPLVDNTVEQAHGVGAQFAAFTLAAMETSTQEETAALAFRARDFEVAVDNPLFRLGFTLGIFPTRTPRAQNPALPFSETNSGFITTEVAVVDIGRARLLLIPGEIDPALFLGGYDGSYTPADRPIVNEEVTNPPDLSMAPDGPYMRDRAAADGFDYVFLFGLANDEIGYLVPPFDYQLNADNPYWEQAPGDHYEETNGLGPNTWPDVEEQMNALLDFTP
ncbi:MAG: neutral/alkaline non-lysosomal ceramidase N-terminal domain-containing protein [Polyangiales bacterium]